MLKSKKNRETAKRFAAIALAFLMVFQYTASGLSMWAWAEDGSEETQEVAQEQHEEKKEKVKEEPKQEPAEKPAEAPAPAVPEKQETEAPQQPEEPKAEEPEAPKAEDEAPAEEKTEKPEEKDEKTEDEEEKYPAQKFTAKASGVTVRISAPEGALPEGTEVTVTAVEPAAVEDAIEKAAGKEVNVVKAVDITFTDKDGKEIEPEKQISVNFENSKFSGLDDPKVFHVKDNGVAEKISEKKTGIYGDQIAINAKDFSVYAVVETEVPRVTVNFVNGSETVATMYVKAEDTEAEVEKILYDPGAGTVPEKQVFKGWTVDQNYTASSQTLSIADIRTQIMTKADEISEDTTVTYYAAVFKQYTVTYVDVEGVTVGTETAEIPSRETEASYKVNQGYSTDDTHNFEGWIVADGQDNVKNYPAGAETETIDGETIYYYKNGTTITITGDVKFSVDAPLGYWLVFDENGKGATYNAPQFIKSGEVTSDADLFPMVRNGYTFINWYTGAPATTGGDPTGEVFEFGHTLSGTTTIYAKWQANTTADYTVLIWKQNVAGDGYDFVESVKVEDAQVGSTPTAVNETTGAVQGGRYTGETGFTYNRTDQASKTVATEGNTVVNVYYNRNEITFNFNLYGYTYTPTTGNQGTQYGLVDGEYVELYSRNGNWYYGYGTRYRGTRYTRSGGWSVYKTMSGLYGSTLADNNYEWPTEYDWYSGYNNQNQPNGTRTTFLDAFLPTSNDTTVEFYGTTPSGSNHIYFYKQNANGNGYTLANTVNTNATGFNLSDKYNGFKCVAWNTTNNTNTWTQVGDLMNQNGNYYYDADPSQNGYQTATIGQNGLHVYFNRLSYSILFYDGTYVDGNNNPIEEDSQGEFDEVSNVTYGADISSYNKGGANYFEPTAPAGYVFEGWYLDDACTHPYTFSTMPEGGLTVYAKWRQIQYRVFLHPNADRDSTLDWGSDNQATNFRVSYGGKVSVPTGLRSGYEFYGWYKDEGCTQAYAKETVLNESTVSAAYDKTKDLTDPSDKWGNDNATSNSDTERFWITKKFDLYAKWSAITPGAKGIGIIYDANGGSGAPSDTALYKDNTSVSAGAAAKAPAGKVFDHWVLQTWNGTAYVDKEGAQPILPGGKFTVLRADARITDANTGALVDPADVVETGSYNYTVQLRAVYKDKEEETPTHIDWYSNYGSENDGKGELYHSYTGIKINEPVDILPAKTRAGYTFKGWTKTKGGTTADFLVWDGTQYKSTVKETEYVVTQVAADEKQPYDDIYAVWEESEVTINYAIASDSAGNGTVSPTSETVKVDTGNPAGSTATPASTAYVFDYWTCDDGTEPVGTDELFVPGKGTSGLYEAHTYYAHFKLNKVDVTVQHYLKGTTTKVAEDVTESWTIGEDYEAQPVTKYQEKDLTVDDYNPLQTITVSAEGDNVIKIYYTLPLTITAATDSKTYDGTPLDGAYTITGALADDEEAINTVLGTAPSITHVADGPKNYQASVDGIPSYYAITNTPGTLTIEPATLTIKTESGSKPYDGTALTATGTITGFVNNETATFKVTGSQTEVGNSENSYTLTWNGTAVESDYTLSEDLGTLTVTNNTTALTIESSTKSWEYDGTAHTDPVYTVTYGEESDEAKAEEDGTYTFELSTGDKIVITPADAATITHVAESDVKNAFSYTLENSSFYTDVTKTEGDLSVTPVTLTVKTESGNKTYDGTPLTADGSIDGFVNNETATFTVTGSQTDVGESENSYTLTWNGTAVETDYTVSEDLGTLEVTADETALTIVSSTKSWEYDGTAHTDPVYTVTYGEQSGTATKGEDGKYTYTLSTGDKIVITPADAATITHVADSSVKNAFSYTLENSTFYSNVTKTEGDLSVTPATLTVTTESDGKTYDGTALTADGSIDGFVNGETATFTVTGSQREVGTSTNTYTLTWDGTAVETDYTLSESLGTLTVTADETSVVVASSTKSWPYDGAAHTDPEYTVTYGDASGTATEGEGGTYTYTLSTGDKIVITPAGSATVTHVADGTVKNAFTYTLENADFYSNVSKSEGDLSVTPVTLTVTTPDADKKYDGTPLTAEGTISGFVNGETATFETTGSQTEVGDSENAYTLTWDGTAAETDYTLSESIGTLTVTTNDVAIVITAGSGEKVYDGAALTNSAVTSTGIPKGLLLSEAATLGAQTDVGSSENIVATYKIINEDGIDVKANFTNITLEPGTLEVTVKEITVRTGSAEKTYDGTPLTKDEASINGLVNSETATIKATGSQTDAGESDNTYEITWDGTAKASNYEITGEELGTLTVTKATLTITASDQTYVYNGQTQGEGDTAYDDPSVIAQKITVEGLKGNDSVKSFVIDGQGKDAGDYDIVLSSADLGDAAENYNIELVNGTLHILPAPLTITADDKAITYGDEIPELTASVSGLIEGEEFDYELQLLDPNDKLNNVGSYTIKVILSGTTKGFRLFEQIGNYSVTANDGTLKINKAPLTVTTGSATKQYDGTALKKAQAKITGLVNDETATVKATGSQRNVGSSKNTYKITWGSTDKNNYKITEKLGTLRVTPADDDDDNPGPGPQPTPVNPTPTPTPTPEPVDDTEVPLPDPAETVPEEETPLQLGSWALINLICTILSVLLSLLVLIFYLGKNKKKADEDEDEAQTEDAEKDQKIKKKGILRIMDIIPAVVAVITFILTEDMSLPMVLTDKWTLLMVVILLVDVVVAVFTKKSTKDAEENQDEAEAQE